MKKLLALVLALVMVMALAVSAFAAIWEIEEDDEDELIELDYVDVWDSEEDKVWVANYPKDHTIDFIVRLENDDGEELKGLTADGTGIVKDVKIFDLDPEKYETDIDGTEAGALLLFKVVDNKSKEKTVVEGYGSCLYEVAKEKAKELNKAEKTTKYAAKPVEDVKVVELTLEGNTGVAYTEGKLTLKAKNEDGDVFTSKMTFINDVAIFKYEVVKSAAEYKEELTIGGLGGDAYSDYLSAKYGYGDDEQETFEFLAHGAYVVPTTAFRAIEGKKLVLVGDNADDGVEVTVTIPSVAKAQKGVNFQYDVEWNYDDADDDGNWDFDEAMTDINVKFYGKQAISSDYTIDLALDVDYFELREYFLKKLEEEDIVTYYINKDGKAFDKFTVDYMTMSVTFGEETIEKELHDDVEITINGKAGTALGDYTLTIKAPSTETEENPNTGAESAVAVIAAMAVVSAVAAAAVTLKK